MLVTQSGSGNKSHRLDFLGDFCICPLPEIVRDNLTNLASDILRISGIYALEETRVNDTIVRAVLYPEGWWWDTGA
jgi:hypothetical protein